MHKRQVEVCESYGSSLVAVAPDEKVGIALNTLRLEPLNALRHLPTSGTSGWYIWGGEELGSAHDFFEPLHSAHLQAYVPQLLPYLGLAPGWRVLLAPGQVEVWRDEKLLHV